MILATLGNEVWAAAAAFFVVTLLCAMTKFKPPGPYGDGGEY